MLPACLPAARGVGFAGASSRGRLEAAAAAAGKREGIEYISAETLGHCG